MESDFDIPIRLKKEELDALLAGQVVVIRLQSPQAAKSRQAAAQADAVPSKVEKLIQAWNDSDLIKNPDGGSRNHSFPMREVDNFRVLLERAIKAVGLPRLLNAMKGYFEACGQGLHIRDGKNFGYSHLAGFARRMTVLQKRNEKPWWERRSRKPLEDPHPTTTKRMADAYAHRFLGRDEYGLKNPSHEYEMFMRAAGRLLRMKNRGLKMNDETAIEYLMDCVEERSHGKGSVTVGWVCSDRTWQHDFPQYLRRMLGLKE